jgi:toxin HigB-1
MIRDFRHKGLERYYRRNDARGLTSHEVPRIARILDRLDAAAGPEDMNLPGFRFHRLKGDRARTDSVTASGNLRITFRFDGEDAIRVNLEDYH